MKSLRIALVGCGWMSTHGHGPALAQCAAENPAVQLVACCDVRADAAETFRTKFGFAQSFADTHTMLDQTQPDAVCVIVPERLTCDVVCDIAQHHHQVAIFTEKPPGLSTAELDRMIAATAGRPVMVAFNRRHQPAMLELKRMIAQAETPIQHVRYTLLRHQRFDADFTTTAIHAIDAARHIAGADYAELTLNYRHLADCPDHVTAYHLTGRFASASASGAGGGTTVELLIDPATDRVIEQAQVTCAGSILEARFDDPTRTPGNPDFIANGFLDEHRAFLQALQTGTPLIDDLQSARQSVALMQALRERRDAWRNA